MPACGKCTLCVPGALCGAFRSCAAVLYVCQMLAILEVINAAVGLVKTPVFPAMIQARPRMKLKSMFALDPIALCDFRCAVHDLLFPGDGEERRSLCGLWQSGGDAGAQRGLLGFLPLEHLGDLQASR